MRCYYNKIRYNDTELVDNINLDTCDLVSKSVKKIFENVINYLQMQIFYDNYRVESFEGFPPLVYILNEIFTGSFYFYGRSKLIF